MNQRTALLIAMLCSAPCGAALADEITFQLNNMSQKPVVALYATPKGDSTASEVNLLSGEIAETAIAEVTLASAEPSCVYDLKIEFGDGSNMDRPDVDLCQTDQLIIN
jgi:hypothetical protein